MSEKEIAIHNIALLYSIHKELHPDDGVFYFFRYFHLLFS